MRKLSMANSGIPSVALGAALVFGPFAEAQVYKWVDEKGVVNYSSTPPENRKSTKLDEDSGRVSTVKSPVADRDRSAASERERALQQRAERLEQEAARNQQTAAQQEAAPQTTQRLSREDCLAQRRIDCDDPTRTVYDTEYVYPYPVTRPIRPLPRPGGGGRSPVPGPMPR